ncbi:MAG: acyltransferase [Solirubrobacterales bacterium]|nr:acyltransferase [Solirubrobacterales bacterium]
MSCADHLVPPAAVRARPRLTHTLRALAARRCPRVILLGHPRLGRGVRLQAAPGARIVLGEGSLIGDGCRLYARGGELRVGAGATLGERCTVVAHAGVAVGEGAVLGAGAMVVDFAHGTDEVEQPIRLQPMAASPVVIGANARVGHGSSVLRGVTIGDRAVVGAHTVVTLDVAADAGAGGPV